MLNRRQEVEVTSVNWQDQDAAAARVSRVLVSYRWHGIVYVTEFSQVLSFTSPSVRCWDITKMAVLQHWPMDEWYAQRILVRPADTTLPNYSGTLSLSPDCKFAATFGLSKYFEVHELKSGVTQNMQWKPSINPRPTSRHIGNMKVAIQTTQLEGQHKLAKSQPVCFAHEGFAVAGAAREKFVYVWDVERGDQLLSLDHGGEFPKHKRE